MYSPENGLPSPTEFVQSQRLELWTAKTDAGRRSCAGCRWIAWSCRSVSFYTKTLITDLWLQCDMLFYDYRLTVIANSIFHFILKDLCLNASLFAIFKWLNFAESHTKSYHLRIYDRTIFFAWIIKCKEIFYFIQILHYL